MKSLEVPLFKVSWTNENGDCSHTASMGVQGTTDNPRIKKPKKVAQFLTQS